MYSAKIYQGDLKWTMKNLQVLADMRATEESMMIFSNSLDPIETPCDTTSRCDPCCLTFKNNGFTKFKTGKIRRSPEKIGEVVGLDLLPVGMQLLPTLRWQIFTQLTPQILYRLSQMKVEKIVHYLSQPSNFPTLIGSAHIIMSSSCSRSVFILQRFERMRPNPHISWLYLLLVNPSSGYLL